MFHVLHVKFDEVMKGHTQAPRRLADEVPLPLQGLLLGLEPALLLVNRFACPVRYSNLGHPAASVAVFGY